jgi:hypothetical protein
VGEDRLDGRDEIRAVADRPATEAVCSDVQATPGVSANEYALGGQIGDLPFGQAGQLGDGSER